MNVLFRYSQISLGTLITFISDIFHRTYRPSTLVSYTPKSWPKFSSTFLKNSHFPEKYKFPHSSPYIIMTSFNLGPYTDKVSLKALYIPLPLVISVTRRPHKRRHGSSSRSAPNDRLHLAGTQLAPGWREAIGEKCLAQGQGHNVAV